MKANEAQEKLYVDATDNPNDVWLRAFRQPFRECGVEYIRTDAFIEKACEWIKEKWDGNYTMPIIIDSVIDEFKNYMKRE